jgi:hypothetical protein
MDSLRMGEKSKLVLIKAPGTCLSHLCQRATGVCLKKVPDLFEHFMDMQFLNFAHQPSHF